MLEDSGAGEESRGLFDDDTEKLIYEGVPEYEEILDNLFAEGRSTQPYSDELFEWTQFTLPEKVRPEEVLARIQYMGKYVEEKEGYQLFTFTLSESAYLSAIIEQSTVIPQASLVDKNDLPQDDPEYLEAQTRARTVDLPKFEVRILQREPEEDESEGKNVVQFKMTRGEVMEFQEIYRKIVRIMAINTE
jgi:hypothetical protein